MYRSPFKVLQKNWCFMESQIPEAQCAEAIFQKQDTICGDNFTNNISISGWTWNNFLKLLTNNFQNKYFHNSLECSGFCLQVHISSRLANILRLAVFRFLEIEFVKLPCPWHDLTINSPCRTDPSKFAQKNCTPASKTSSSSSFFNFKFK